MNKKQYQQLVKNNTIKINSKNMKTQLETIKEINQKFRELTIETLKTEHSKALKEAVELKEISKERLKYALMNKKNLTEVMTEVLQKYYQRRIDQNQK